MHASCKNVWSLHGDWGGADEQYTAQMAHKRMLNQYQISVDHSIKYKYMHVLYGACSIYLRISLFTEHQKSINNYYYQSYFVASFHQASYIFTIVML